MQTKKYRVECVDRDSGAKTFHVFDGVDAKAAADLANRMGFLVGETVEVPTDQRRAFPWGVALASLVLGAGLGAGGLFAVASGRSANEPAKLTSTPTIVLPDAKPINAIEQPPKPSIAKRDAPIAPVVTELPKEPENAAAKAATSVPSESSLHDEMLIVRRKYDRFKDYTHVRAGIELKSKSGETLYISLLESGEGDVSRVQSIAGTQLAIHARAPWDDHDFVMLVNAKGNVSRITVTTEWKGDDIHIAYLTRGQLGAIASADSVEGKWWTFEGSLTDDSLSRIREFLNYLK